MQGNGFFQDLRYRGFAASPLAGHAAGPRRLSRRHPDQRGIRRHGELGPHPAIAIDRIDLWTNNPMFGLNALGGAVNMQMKNGFTWQGFEAEALGGSFGRLQGSLQYGAQKGNFAVYFAAQAAARRWLALPVAVRLAPHLCRRRLAGDGTECI